MKYVITPFLICTFFLSAFPVHAMTTPILISNTAAAPSTSSSNYLSLAATGGDGYGGATNRDTPLPITGTLSKLYVRIPVALSSGSYTVTLYKNGSATSLAVTLDSSSGNAVVDSSDTVSVSAGDVVRIQISPLSPSPAPTRMQISAVLDGTTEGESAVFSGTGSITNAGTRYMDVGMETGASLTDTLASVVVPASGTFDNFYVNLSTAPGTSKSYAFTLMQNGSATSLTCTVSDSATTCNDTTPGHAVTITAGDKVSIRSVPTGSPSIPSLYSGMRWVPTVNGESLMFSTSDGLSSSAASYMYTGGYVSSSATESNQASVAPIAFTWKKLYMDFNTAPGSGKSRSVAARINSVTQSLTATMSDTNTATNDTTNTASVSAGDVLNWITTPSGTPAASNNFRVSGVMYIAPSVILGPSGLSSSKFRIFGGTFQIIGGRLIFQ